MNGNAELTIDAIVAHLVQWTMINRLLRTLWPKLTAAILKEVIVQMKPILQETLADVSAGGASVRESSPTLITTGPHLLNAPLHGTRQ